MSDRGPFTADEPSRPHVDSPLRSGPEHTNRTAPASRSLFVEATHLIISKEGKTETMWSISLRVPGHRRLPVAAKIVVFD